jgi:hypothetical protein
MQTGEGRLRGPRAPKGPLSVQQWNNIRSGRREHAIRYGLMPHTPKSRAKALRKINDRRRHWLTAHGPCVTCQSWERLEVHHRDRTQKINHRVWSWSEARRTAELAKCDVMCRRCHIVIHSTNRRKPHGRGEYDRGCRCEVCRAAKATAAARYALAHPDRIRAQTRAWREAHSYRDQYIVVGRTAEGESDA